MSPSRDTPCTFPPSLTLSSGLSCSRLIIAMHLATSFHPLLDQLLCILHTKEAQTQADSGQDQEVIRKHRHASTASHKCPENVDGRAQNEKRALRRTVCRLMTCSLSSTVFKARALQQAHTLNLDDTALTLSRCVVPGASKDCTDFRSPTQSSKESFRFT